MKLSKSDGVCLVGSQINTNHPHTLAFLSTVCLLVYVTTHVSTLVWELSVYTYDFQLLRFYYGKEILLLGFF